MFKYVVSHNFNGGVVANMTLAIPEQLHAKMAKHKEIRWSSIARGCFEKKINELELAGSILKDSVLSENDAEEIGHKIKAEISKRFGKRFGAWKR